MSPATVVEAAPEEVVMKVVLEIGERVRCDILTWSGNNFGGKRTALRIFPTGSVQGELDSELIHSMVIRAHHGTRLILSTRSSGDFEDAPWRCVRLIEGHTLPAEDPRGLPGVRLPDLDLIDEPKAMRTRHDLQSSYPLVERFEEGETWTFGTTGIPALKGHVRRIIIEKDDGPRQRKLSEGERVARAILGRARELGVQALPELLEAAGDELGAEELAELRGWLERPA
jgi:hypothetical protein